MLNTKKVLKLISEKLQQNKKPLTKEQEQLVSEALADFEEKGYEIQSPAVEIFDLSGKKVYGIGNAKTNSLKVSVTNFVNGTYIVKTTIDGETTTEKVIVKH